MWRNRHASVHMWCVQHKRPQVTETIIIGNMFESLFGHKRALYQKNKNNAYDGGVRPCSVKRFFFHLRNHSKNAGAWVSLTYFYYWLYLKDIEINWVTSIYIWLINCNIRKYFLYTFLLLELFWISELNESNYRIRTRNFSFSSLLHRRCFIYEIALGKQMDSKILPCRVIVDSTSNEICMLLPTSYLHKLTFQFRIQALVYGLV